MNFSMMPTARDRLVARRSGRAAIQMSIHSPMVTRAFIGSMYAATLVYLDSGEVKRRVSLGSESALLRLKVIRSPVQNPIPPAGLSLVCLDASTASSSRVRFHSMVRRATDLQLVAQFDPSFTPSPRKGVIEEL